MKTPRPPVQLTDKDRARFERRVLRTPGGCWEWQGYCNAQGYGQFSIRRKNYLAHRLAYEMATGTHPGEKLVCHRCDNPTCVNPEHLWLGSYSDNLQDAIAKGRFPMGGSAICVRCGHVRTDDYVAGDGRRRCLPCLRRRDQRARARQQAQRIAQVTAA